MGGGWGVECWVAVCAGEVGVGGGDGEGGGRGLSSGGCIGKGPCEGWRNGKGR